MAINIKINYIICYVKYHILQVGALTGFIDGVSNPYDGNLTFLGRVLSSLPVDIHLGKLCVLGHVFGCLEEAIVVGMVIYHICTYINFSPVTASALSLKSMFIHPYKRPMDGYKYVCSLWYDHTIYTRLV